MQVKERLLAKESGSSVNKFKTDIFSPRSPVYRAPLSSRRNNGNLAVGAGNATGFILPQAAYIDSLQQQHLQRNDVSLYSPRSKGGLHTALRGQVPASGISPRRTQRSPSKDHAGSSVHSNLSQPATHAAAAASRPAVPQLRLQQQHSQLFSPRQYIKPAPLEALTARAPPHHSNEHASHAQQAVTGSYTWRGQPASSHHAAAHQQQQPLQTSPTTSLASRSALTGPCIHTACIQLETPGVSLLSQVHDHVACSPHNSMVNVVRDRLLGLSCI